MRKCLLVSAIFLISGLAYPSLAVTWTIEKVTDNTESDVNPFVAAVQSSLIVVYTLYDADNEVFVANNFSGTWTSNRVTDNTYSDLGFDIAARYNEQTAHIPVWWVDAPDQEISYCTGSGSSWNISRITDDAADDAWPSIALDNSGFVHVIYQKLIGADWEIFYANNVTGSWVSEQVTDNNTNDVVPWFALDKQGNPRVVYVNDGPNGIQLFFTYKTAGIWTTPVPVAGGFNANSFPFIVLDGNDKAHVTYAKSDGVHNQIYYANDVTGTWQESKVTTSSYDNGFPTIWVDPSAKAHIAYVAAEPGDLEMFYANNVAGIWSTGRVTDNGYNDGGVMGRYFVCDASGVGHIFFWNSSDGDNEIYHAYSNEHLFAGVEEPPSPPSPSSPSPVTPLSSPSITVESVLFSNSIVSYSIPSSGAVSLRVYDASGSLVKTLVDGTLSSGCYSIAWNGFADSGSKVTNGVYFIRLVTPAGVVSAKTILR